MISYACVDFTQEQHDELMDELLPRLKSYPGFVAHAGGATAGAFDVVEIWDSEQQHRAWYDAEIRLRLPQDTYTAVRKVELTTVLLRD